VDFSSVPVETVSFGVFTADLRARELHRHGVRLRLPDQSFLVLAMLLEHPGEVVTREDIQKRLWPGEIFVDFDHGLNNAVNRLREALGDSAELPRFIQTLPRRGYRFIATTNGAARAKADTEVTSAEGMPEPRTSDVALVRAAEMPKSRSRRTLLLTVSILLALALLLTFKQWISPVPPSTRTFVLPPEGTTFNLIRDSGGPVILSADGTKLAFVATDAKGTARVWVRPLSSFTAQALNGTEGATFPFWSPDGRWIAFFSDADQKLKKISLTGGPAVSLCDAPFGRGGSWSRHGVILFTPDTFAGLYKVSDSGGRPVPVTSVDRSIHTSHRWPKFLPDGRHFIYLAVNHRHDASHDGVYLGSLDSGENKPLVASHADATYASGYLFFLLKDVLMAQHLDFERGELQGERRPTVEKVVYDPSIWKAVFDVSDHGFMAYQLGGYVNGSRLSWFDRSGNPLGSIGEPGFYSAPVLSHDGRKLLAGRVTQFGHYSDLWVYDFARGVGTRLTYDDNDVSRGIWSRDDTRVLFSAKGQDHYSLYELDASGAGERRLILDIGVDIGPSDISPDGLYVLAGGPEQGRGQLWLYSISGMSSFPLVQHGTQRQGQFSPDGHWVAYTSNESGRDEVYVIPFHPPSRSNSQISINLIGKWQVSNLGGQEPKWSSDGKELFYVAPDNMLMSVLVASKDSKFEVGPSRPLFRPAYNYDVSRDGSKIIINGGIPPETTAPITLVQNWLSDFKK
jgi:DNA-binding winged helix-turn-helix (wHTH) protein/Tol biopolymer transport system component